MYPRAHGVYKCIEICMVFEGWFSRDELPQDNPEGVNINLTTLIQVIAI